MELWVVGVLVEQLCSSYDVEKYINSPTNEVSSSTLAPLTPEELKVDKIVPSWIFTTLSDALQAQLVVARPKSAKEAWALISDIVKDNKRSRTNALKADLDSHVNDEDVVHYALEGLPDKYDQVCGYMHFKDTFPDLKTARSLLITEEMRLKSKALVSPVDSFSPMVLMAGLGTPLPSTTTTQVKSWRPCFNFAKGTCRFGESCRYVHDVNARTGNTSNASNAKGRGTNDTPNTTNELLTKLLHQLGTIGINTNIATSPNATTPTVAFHTVGPNQPITYPYYMPAQATQSPTGPLTTTPFTQPVGTTVQPGNVGPTTLSRQATSLPHAFNTKTLQDPNSGV
ncbi:ribonuclease H-like domain-containing protein [Tanacetum coccineum]